MSRKRRNSRPVRSKEHFPVFGAPAIEDAEIDEVVASLKSGWLGTGPKAAKFERDFAAYKGASHAIAVHSCTATLHLSLLELVYLLIFRRPDQDTNLLQEPAETYCKCIQDNDIFSPSEIDVV